MKFSIILPVKNGGDYIKECVQLILAQIYTDFNLHILENKSTDGTAEWLQTLKDERIIIIPSEKSLSIEENWARILSIQKNEFMTMIGHDDVLNENYLSVMSELINKHPKASLYQTHFTYINEKGSFISNCFPMDEIQSAHEFLASFMCRTINSTGTGYMMRSKDYQALNGIDVKFTNLIFADYALWIKLSLIGYKATSPEFTFQYRIHDSVSKITNGEDYQNAFECFINFLAEHKNNDTIKKVIDNYGKEMLMYYCESLSHRILKTPKNKRKITVKAFIKKCKNYADVLIPGQEFLPLKRFKIKIAQTFDSSSLNRSFFKLYKKLT